MTAGNADNKCAAAFYLLISLECGKKKSFKPLFSISALKAPISFKILLLKVPNSNVCF